VPDGRDTAESRWPTVSPDSIAAAAMALGSPEAMVGLDDDVPFDRLLSAARLTVLAYLLAERGRTARSEGPQDRSAGGPDDEGDAEPLPLTGSKGSEPRPAFYRCPVCVGTGSLESSDSTDDRWWDCDACAGTGRVADRRRG
jgi:hypothetical protein